MKNASIVMSFVLSFLVMSCSGVKILWKSVPQGDFAADTRDPKDVCEKLEKEQGLDSCDLIEYKASQDEKECADGRSVAGCFACKFECR